MVPLRGDVVTCTSRRTGFLGTGGLEVAAEIANLDVEGGTFTVHYYGEYPGGGEQLEGTGSVTLGPLQRAEAVFPIRSHDGSTGGSCRLVPPMVQRWQ